MGDITLLNSYLKNLLHSSSHLGCKIIKSSLHILWQRSKPSKNFTSPAFCYLCEKKRVHFCKTKLPRSTSSQKSPFPKFCQFSARSAWFHMEHPKWGYTTASPWRKLLSYLNSLQNFHPILPGDLKHILVF